MSPLSDQIVQCDHGLMFGECWKCWERKALRAEEEIARLTAERDACQQGMYENAVEIKNLNAKIAKQIEELNTVIRQKWEIEGQLERCAKSVKALVAERDALKKRVEELEEEAEYLLNTISNSVLH